MKVVGRTFLAVLDLKSYVVFWAKDEKASIPNLERRGERKKEV